MAPVYDHGAPTSPGGGGGGGLTEGRAVTLIRTELSRHGLIFTPKRFTAGWDVLGSQPASLADIVWNDFDVATEEGAGGVSGESWVVNPDDTEGIGYLYFRYPDTLPQIQGIYLGGFNQVSAFSQEPDFDDHHVWRTARKLSASAWSRDLRILFADA